MAVNLDACIQCNRCVRACRDEQVNDVIGYALRGEHSKIVFDLDDPMGDSTCVACGECVQACPTGALMPKSYIGSQAVDRKVDSVCPFCGVGCLHHLQRQGREDRQRRWPRRPGQPQPPVREGPLRLRLRAPPAAPDQAADPQAWRAQGLRRCAAARRLERSLPRSQLGRSAGARRRQAQGPARHARPEGAGRVRLRQGQQRGGLPVPEAGAHRLRQQQRRPLHPAVPCVQRRGAARRRGLGRA